MLIPSLVRNFVTSTPFWCYPSSLSEGRNKHTHKHQSMTLNMCQNLGQNVRETGKLLCFSMADGLVVLGFMMASGL